MWVFSLNSYLDSVQDSQEFLRCFMDQLHEELKCKESITEEEGEEQCTDSGRASVVTTALSSDSVSNTFDRLVTNCVVYFFDFSKPGLCACFAANM